MTDPPVPRSDRLPVGPFDSEAMDPHLPTLPPTNAPTQLPEAANDLRVGTGPTRLPAIFGRYRLEKLLGKGGMGTVYLAHDAQLDRHVALKVPAFGPDDEAMRERFFREARAAATLHHPNLCPVFDVGDVDGVFYLTMAYIDGKPLTACIPAAESAGTELVLPHAARLVKVLAEALQEAHDHGIIHRDLKPANIMIDRKNQPVIMDFGLARRGASQDQPLTHSGAIIGTPAYMPPEQVNGDVAAMGPGCDIYSLGIILYELLTGRRPFAGPTGALLAQIVRDPPPPPSQFRPDLDPALEAICLKALAKQPQDRYSSMRAFAAELESWLAGKAPPPLPADMFPPPLVQPIAEPTEVVPRTKRRTANSRRAKQPAETAPLITPGQKWLLMVCGVLFLICVVPAGGIALIVVYTVGAVNDGMARAGKWMEDLQQDQQRILAEQKTEQQKWESLARAWKPPPADAGPAQLFPAEIGKYRLAENDEKSEVPELNLLLKGQRALYRGPDVHVELFAIRANKHEKDNILRQARSVAAFQGVQPGPFPGGPLPGGPMAGGPLVGGPQGSGPADGRYFSYELAAGKGRPEQHGILWWDRGWLFLARADAPAHADEFLKEYIPVIGRDGAAAKDDLKP